MPVTIVNPTLNDNTGSTGTQSNVVLAAALDTTFAVGDLVIATFSQERSDIHTGPTGWTLLYNSGAASTALTASVRYKYITDQAELDDIVQYTTSTTRRMVEGLTGFRNAGIPVIVNNAHVQNGASTFTLIHPAVGTVGGVTPAVGGYLMSVAAARSSALPWTPRTFTPAAGWTKNIEIGTTDTANVNPYLFVASKAVTVAGTQAAVTHTVNDSSTSYFGMTIYIPEGTAPATLSASTTGAVKPGTAVKLSWTGTGTLTQTAGPSPTVFENQTNSRTIRAPYTNNGSTLTYTFGGASVSIPVLKASRRRVVTGGATPVEVPLAESVVAPGDVVVPTDALPPNPTNFRITGNGIEAADATKQWVDLAWDAPADPDVDNYRIRVDGAFVGQPGGTTYRVRNLARQNASAQAITYTFTVRTYDNAGQVSLLPLPTLTFTTTPGGGSTGPAPTFNEAQTMTIEARRYYPGGDLYQDSFTTLPPAVRKNAYGFFEIIPEAEGGWPEYWWVPPGSSFVSPDGRPVIKAKEINPGKITDGGQNITFGATRRAVLRVPPSEALGFRNLSGGIGLSNMHGAIVIGMDTGQHVWHGLTGTSAFYRSESDAVNKINPLPPYNGTNQSYTPGMAPPIGTWHYSKDDPPVSANAGNSHRQTVYLQGWGLDSLGDNWPGTGFISFEGLKITGGYAYEGLDWNGGNTAKKMNFRLMLVNFYQERVGVLMHPSTSSKSPGGDGRQIFGGCAEYVEIGVTIDKTGYQAGFFQNHQAAEISGNQPNNPNRPRMFISHKTNARAEQNKEVYGGMAGPAQFFTPFHPSGQAGPGFAYDGLIMEIEDCYVWRTNDVGTPTSISGLTASSVPWPTIKVQDVPNYVKPEQVGQFYVMPDDVV